MDFGKFKYENSKKEKASRKHQSTVVVKEVKFRPKTDIHDLEFKVKHIRRFLAEGNKCRLVIVFRGREIVHPETGQAMLDAVIKALGDSAMIEQRAAMEGRRMVLTIGPRMGVIRPGVPGAPGAGPAGPGTGPGTGPGPGSVPAVTRPIPPSAVAPPRPAVSAAPRPAAPAGAPTAPRPAAPTGASAAPAPAPAPARPSAAPPVSAPAEGGGPGKVAAAPPKAKA
jgi:translation initiation factor IF-3